VKRLAGANERRGGGEAMGDGFSDSDEHYEAVKPAQKVELLLLLRGLQLMPDLIDAHCGNSEGTPCDDNRHSYVCREHRWIADVRRLVERMATKQKNRRGKRAKRAR
jgi:hypothetical protein